MFKVNCTRTIDLKVRINLAFKENLINTIQITVSPPNDLDTSNDRVKEMNDSTLIR